jgi:FO synthase
VHVVRRLTDREALLLADVTPAARVSLMADAARVRTEAWGRELTYSPKVFLPVTNLCRDRCGYCAFRRSEGSPGEWTMLPHEIEQSLLSARELGCLEALVCLGDRPETAYPGYRRTLASLGHDSTADYLVWVCGRALELGLLPHTNAGLLTSDELQRLRPVNASVGLMLETTSSRLGLKGMAHHGAVDKRPAARLAMLARAGELRIPFTTGILVGIGETRRERVEALLAIRAAHERHGHIQEVIVQNFTPHAGTPLARAPAPSADDMAHAVALARLILPDDVSVQAPPNLNPDRTALLVESGINDFGGISPLTPDFINPGKPWPHVEALRAQVAESGFRLAPRLCVYDSFLEHPGFVDPALLAAVSRCRASLRSEVS